jgi:transcriptional regulator with XRE-family HTH domain
MTTASEIREFLTSRRARLSPEQAGLGAHGTRRRVPGLRREEVATLAGISIEYYTQLERGNAKGASEEVLDAVSRALQLDEAERSHLFDLVRAANPGRARRRVQQQRIRPSVQWALDAVTATPAILRDDRLTLLAANDLGRALYAPVFESSHGPANFARFTFLDPGATQFFIDWEKDSGDCVALLRAAAGRDPYDRELSDLVGELATRSEEFRTRWASHNVKRQRTGIKNIHHPVVGDLTLHLEAAEFPFDPCQTMVIYTTEPGSPSRESMNLLASWTADHDDNAREANPRPTRSPE